MKQESLVEAVMFHGAAVAASPAVASEEELDRGKKQEARERKQEARGKKQEKCTMI